MAVSSTVFMHGITEFANNSAGKDGGNDITTVNRHIFLGYLGLCCGADSVMPAAGLVLPFLGVCVTSRT